MVTEAKLNLAANPIINLFGAISTASIANGSVTNVKLAVGVLSADTTGRALVANGFTTLPMLSATIGISQSYLDDTTRLDAAGYAAGTTTAGAIAATLGTIPAGYFAGMTVKILIDTTNTGATTLNLNALGAKNIYKNVNVALAAGDLVAGAVVTMIYDGTNFQIPTPPQPSFYRAGTFSGSGTFSITFSSAVPNTNYAAVFNQYFQGLSVVSKTVNGFTLTIASGTVSGDYVIIPYK